MALIAIAASGVGLDDVLPPEPDWPSLPLESDDDSADDPSLLSLAESASDEESLSDEALAFEDEPRAV